MDLQKEEIEKAICTYKSYISLIQNQRNILEDLENLAFSNFMLQCENIKEIKDTEFYRDCKQPNCS